MKPTNKNIMQLHNYSLRNTSRAGCIDEFYLLFQLLNKTKDVKEVRRMLMDNEILGHFTYYTRLTIWKLFSARYLSIEDKWVIDELSASTSNPKQSNEFNSLLYLYFIVRDRFAFEFVVKVIFKKYSNSSFSIDLADIYTFFDELSLENDAFNKMTNSSKKKLLSNTLTTLVDFKVLEGKRIKIISKPSIPQKTIYHLYRILKLQNYSYEQIVKSEFWRIFLWDTQDVRRNLIDLLNNPDFRENKDNDNE